MVGNVFSHVYLCVYLSVCLSVCVSVCLSVQAIIFESLLIETSFWCAGTSLPYLGQFEYQVHWVKIKVI